MKEEDSPVSFMEGIKGVVSNGDNVMPAWEDEFYAAVLVSSLIKSHLSVKMRSISSGRVV